MRLPNDTAKLHLTKLHPFLSLQGYATFAIDSDHFLKTRWLLVNWDQSLHLYTKVRYAPTFGILTIVFVRARNFYGHSTPSGSSMSSHFVSFSLEVENHDQITRSMLLLTSTYFVESFCMTPTVAFIAPRIFIELGSSTGFWDPLAKRSHAGDFRVLLITTLDLYLT